MCKVYSVQGASAGWCPLLHPAKKGVWVFLCRSNIITEVEQRVRVRKYSNTLFSQDTYLPTSYTPADISQGQHRLKSPTSAQKHLPPIPKD